MKKSIQIAGAFIGVIVGAGFASGQEILQFFTSFGWMGIIGAVVATFLFAFLGMNLTQLGSRLQTDSHKDVIYHICGKYLGMAVDLVITFFLFGVAAVMLAGSGSIFEEQFGIPGMAGNIIMAVLAILTVCLNIQKVISIISLVTPFLLLMVILIGGYAISTIGIDLAEVQKLAESQTPAASNWFIGALLYVSYNIAAGAAMLTVMGGTTKDEKQAGLGGILGGVGLGVLILLINVGLLVKMDVVGGSSMPILALANEISPAFGIFMFVVLLGMIYNTAVGMLYAFTARFVKRENPKFNLFVVLFGAAAFGASFVGFITLVGTVYPLMGYLGFTLIAAIVAAWFRGKRKTERLNIGIHAEQ
ncbi:YkvI family membrane protein [Bacillus sp. J33]|uniref:YkvI family membrane protein n=1 Tax=Bacillus sp. J33 TaxID=935836 RepID=UPI000479C364|nr:membrane protein [Bacillus sp. J33]